MQIFVPTWDGISSLLLLFYIVKHQLWRFISSVWHAVKSHSWWVAIWMMQKIESLCSIQWVSWDLTGERYSIRDGFAVDISQLRKTSWHLLRGNENCAMCILWVYRVDFFKVATLTMMVKCIFLSMRVRAALSFVNLSTGKFHCFQVSYKLPELSTISCYLLGK